MPAKLVAPDKDEQEKAYHPARQEPQVQDAHAKIETLPHDPSGYHQNHVCEKSQPGLPGFQGFELTVAPDLFSVSFGKIL